MTPLRRCAIVLALLFAPTACGRGCGCIEGERTYETLNGKRKIALVRDVHWTGGRVPGPETSFFFRVDTTPPIKHFVGCDHLDLGENDAGTLVAYRCTGNAPWNVLRLRGEDRYVFDCGAPVGTGDKPDFRKIDTILQGKDRIFACAEDDRSHYDRWDELLRALEEDVGPDEPAALLKREADKPITDSDPWSWAMVHTSAAVRSRVLATVCPALADPDALPQRYAHAAAHCDLPPDPNLGAAAAKQLERLLPSTPDGTVEAAMQWAAVIGTVNAPKATGAAVCGVVDRIAENNGGRPSPSARTLAQAILVRTKTRCAAASAWVATDLCSSVLDCDAALCTAMELDTRFDGWAELPGLDGGARPKPLEPPQRDVLRLAFAYNAGPLDHETQVRNARRNYAWADAGSAPDCDEATAGQACACSEAVPDYSICELDASTTRMTLGPCSFRIDDKTRRFVDVRSLHDAGAASPDAAPKDAAAIP